MNKIYILSLVIGVVLWLSCSDTNHEPSPTSKAGVTVSSSGGSLQSPDKIISIAIPPGAVNKNVFVEIKELDSNVPDGIGKIYSLTDLEFLQPVTLTLKYSDDELNLKGTNPELLQLVTRKSAAESWLLVSNFTVDVAKKTISAAVNHFSDWTIITKKESIDPPGTKISPSGGSLESPDKNITVSIPPGAVNQNIFVEIKEVTNNSTGIGKIYSLTEQEFLQPVILTLKYTDQEVTSKGTYPSLLQLVTRKSESENWQVVSDFTLDPSKKTLTAAVSHFSEWTIMSTEGTLDFSVDGVSYNNLALTVITNNMLGKPAKFLAGNEERYFRAAVDSTVMGTSFETRSGYLGKISARTTQYLTDTANVLFVEPRLQSCYNRGGGSTRFRFTAYSTVPGELVTGTFSLVGVLPTDNSACQERKIITGSFAYKVK